MTSDTIIQLVLAGALLIVLVFTIRYFYRLLFGVKRTLNATVKENWILILEKEFPYYTKLPKKSQEKFLQKLNNFYRAKVFIPKRDFVLDERKKTLICATAAQLTFGLPLLKLSHFERILIFDKKVYLKGLMQQTYSKAHNTEGRMYFSWDEIQKGFDNPNDGFNIVLHKLAEALLFENGKLNEEYNFIDKEYLDELMKLYRSEKKLLKSGEHPFLSQAGSDNFEDFFAISVENYFERPLLFKEQMPTLYKTMSKVLNQDTAILQGLNKEV